MAEACQFLIAQVLILLDEYASSSCFLLFSSPFAVS